MQTALQARKRQLLGVTDISAATRPVSKDEAAKRRLMDRGSVLGRLWADGVITAQELAAGNDYCDRFLAYSRLTGLPSPTISSVPLGDARGRGLAPDRPAAAERAREAHYQDQHLLRATGELGVLWSMERACIRDEEAPARLVKLGLAALVAAGR